MKVGDKVRVKYDSRIGTVVKVNSRVVFVAYEDEPDPIPYRRSILVKVS